MTRQVCVLTSSRADYGLQYWLLRELQRDPSVSLSTIVSGTHLSDRHGRTVNEIVADGIPITSQVNLNLDDDSSVGVARSLAAGTIGYAEALSDIAPDLFVVLGDRYETLAAAQAAMLLKIPIAHLHGGESTEGLIDEAIRHAVTKMSHLHFVAAAPFRARVIQLGEQPDRVFCVGALGLDNIAQLNLPTRKQLESDLQFDLGRRLFLVTYHPVTLSHAPPVDGIQALVDALDSFPEAQIIITGVNADPQSAAVQSVTESFAARWPNRVHLARSLGQRRYLAAMREADCVIGNSSSGLLEAPAMGTPTVNVGNRQRGRLRAPAVIDCAETRAAIQDAIERSLSPAIKAVADRKETPYGTPGAARRIASVLREYPLADVLMKRFFDAPVQLI
jgi:UDP-N-acetylglucosamine 2-epimerase (non-hydrolysing)/GDP/UDP-N,N'-diacetylbacillosamine 2-epimerase (hydrolysing)